MRLNWGLTTISGAGRAGNESLGGIAKFTVDELR